MNTMTPIPMTTMVRPVARSDYDNHEDEAHTDIEIYLQHFETSSNEKLVDIWKALNHVYDDTYTPFSAALEFELGFRALIEEL